LKQRLDLKVPDFGATGLKNIVQRVCVYSVKLASRRSTKAAHFQAAFGFHPACRLVAALLLLAAKSA
jgi:hypothetical protein